MGLFSWSQPVRCEEQQSSPERRQKVLDTQRQIRDSTADLTEKAREKAKDTATAIGLTQNPADAEYNKWVKTFNQWAQEIDQAGVKYMAEDQFIKAIAPSEDFIKIGKRQYGLLYRVADRSKQHKVTLEDYVDFQRLLKLPDAEFRVAFSVFDVDRDGTLSLDEFKRVFSENLGPRALPFNFDTPWLKMYMGRQEGDHVMNYAEFTQMMKGLQGERVRQAFTYLDKAGSGYITGGDFARIIREIARHKLSDHVIERLPSLSQLTSSGRVSYSELRAFINVIKEIDLVEIVVKHAVNKSRDSRITKEDFLDAAGQYTRYGVFTPLEADIIFHFARPDDPQTSSKLRLRDFNALFDPKWEAMESEEQIRQPSLLHDIGKAIYNFGLGGIAGGLGATAVYPIDLVKTRMQNQRSKVVGELLYRNSMDCVRKVYKNEGLRGFYRGLPPQLLGVAPEKAIKLTVNDFVRSRATDKETGKIKLGWEFIAGGAAGGSQVIFTNPLEIVKIRLQMQGEAPRTADSVKRGAMHIVRQLGLVGLYKGAPACLLRDVPFSMIYFTSYNHLKKDYFGEGKNGKKLGFGETLLAASIAGMPSAYLTTPADVVKTRLQTEARKGETHYNGLVDAFRKIFSEEGFGALFKGGPARVLRSSPQFGVTLVAYETLQATIPYPLDKKAPAILRSEEEITKIRARRALRTLLDVHEVCPLFIEFILASANTIHRILV